MRTVGSFAFFASFALAVLALGCDEAADPDAGVDAASGEVDAASGEEDAATPGDDAGPSTCFPLSGPSPDLPDAIPSTFTASSATWMRPTGEICPATGLGDTAVPFETVCYVNDTGADLGVTFEVTTDGDRKPAAVVYDGDGVPADPTQCAAVSTDLVIDVADAFYTVPAGATVTFVATLQDPGESDFQFVITPE